jgi:hypothetical protein
MKKRPFKMKGMTFKSESPVKQPKKFIKYNAAGQRVNMMGVPHGTPRSKLTAIGSLKDKFKHLYKRTTKIIPGLSLLTISQTAKATQPGTGTHGGKKVGLIKDMIK